MKSIVKRDNLYKKIVEAVDEYSDCVGSTLGPKGRNVIIHQKGKNPIITKDGATCGVFYESQDPIKNTIISILKQAAATTAIEAGDGSTTSAVLTQAIVKNSQKYLAKGISPYHLKNGMELTLNYIRKYLIANAKTISCLEDVKHIAKVATNGDTKIAELLATAVDKVGKDGAITIEEAKSSETKLDIIEGFQFDSGIVSNQFITDERRMVLKYNDPYILVTDYSIEALDELMPILELVARAKKSLVIVAENFDGEALAALIYNTVKGTMKVAAIKAPRYGEERRSIMQDLAIATGSKLIARELGLNLSETKLKDLGNAKTIEASRGWTTIIGGKGEYSELEKRIEQIKTEISNTKAIKECEALQERISRLSSGIAIIKVGGSTEIEMIEKKHRVEDALEAIKSAQQEGIVLGGGITFLKLADGLEELMNASKNTKEYAGIEIVKRSLEEPFKRLCFNADLSHKELYTTIKKRCGNNIGFDFSSNKYVDLLLMGIVDPAKVIRCSLENAISVASTLLTTSFSIVEN